MRYFKPERLQFHPKGAIKVTAKSGEAVAYLYERAGKPHAVMFVGRAQRPTWHFSFKNVAAREKRIAETFESVVQRNVGKAVARAVKKQFVNPYKVGDLFKSSWGYEQTNVDYYEVTAVKGKFVVIEAIGKKYIETGFMSGPCTPQPGAILTGQFAFKKKCLAQDGRVRIESWRTASFLKPEKMIGTLPVYGTSYESHYA